MCFLSESLAVYSWTRASASEREGRVMVPGKLVVRLAVLWALGARRSAESVSPDSHGSRRAISPDRPHNRQRSSHSGRGEKRGSQEERSVEIALRRIRGNPG